MTVTYFTVVSNELLPEVQSGERMLESLRFKRVVGQIVGPYQMTLVEFEDDDADPVFYAGRTVTPTIQAHYDEAGTLTHTTVTDRHVVITNYRVVS